MWLTAGLFHLMVDDRVEDLRPLRQLLAGGDVLSPARARRFLSAVPGCELVNGYGPTETTTFAACHSIRTIGPDSESVPLGRPIANTTIWILDEDGRCVPMGQPGEIAIGGDGVARGYLNRPELTREKFGPDPFSAEKGMRLYRTGDRGRIRPDGALEFLGRMDGQLKVSGRRVEPEEIEAAIEKHPAVAQAVVAARADGNGDKTLLAWVRPRPGSPPSALEAGALRRFLADRLPRFMVPGEIVPVDAFPLTPAGKVDRRALWERAGQKPANRAADRETAPAPVEESILEIWREVLGREDVGREENFFDAGGQSLGLLRVHSQIRARLGVDLELATMFDRPTVRSLAEHLRDRPGGAGAGSDGSGRLRALNDRLRRDPARRSGRSDAR